MVSRRTYLRLLAGVAGGHAAVGSTSAHTAGVAAQTDGQAPTQQATLVAGDGDGGDKFGWAVAIDGNTALVSAIADADPNGSAAGSAYVFQRANGEWTQQADLIPEDGDSGDLFGSSVALDGSRALVGAYFDEHPNGPRAGSAYVFEEADGGWSQAAKLAPDSTAVGDQLGWSVSLDGDTALVGAPQDTDTGGGAVRVFEEADGGWSQTTKFAPEDTDEDEFFGMSVSHAEGTALVGAARTTNSEGERTGAAYLFDEADGEWSQAAKLTAEDAGADDEFGFAADLGEETAIVGARNHSGSDGLGGAAYVFERGDGEWSQAAKLTADDGAEGDEFGWSVALAGETALVGAHRHDDPNAKDAGAAYVYERGDGGWGQTATLAPAEGTKGARAGTAVALGAGTGLVGASQATTGTDDAKTGSVAVYSVDTRTTPTPTQTPSPTPSPTPTPRDLSTPTATPGTDGPGFGVLAALSGLAGWAWWRRSRREP